MSARRRCLFGNRCVGLQELVSPSAIPYIFNRPLRQRRGTRTAHQTSDAQSQSHSERRLAGTCLAVSRPHPYLYCTYFCSTLAELWCSRECSQVTKQSLITTLFCVVFDVLSFLTPVFAAFSPTTGRKKRSPSRYIPLVAALSLSLTHFILPSLLLLSLSDHPHAV
jgi:hypothetical protein